MDTPTLSEAAARFLAQYDNSETVRNYRNAIRLLPDDLVDRPISAVTAEALDDWRVALRERGLAPATIGCRIRVIKAFFNWCVRRDYLDSSPARFLKAPHYHPDMASKAMPEQVVKAVLRKVRYKTGFTDRRDAAILALMTTFGSRAGDVARLRLSYLRCAGQGRIKFVVKGGKIIYLPLPDETAVKMEDWLEIRRQLDPDPVNDFVFVSNRTSPGRRYQPLRPDSISRMVRRLSKDVSGRTYGAHSIRHWKGQSLADARVPPTIVQAILAHSDVKTTLDHYYNQDDERVAAVLDEHQVK